MKLSLKQIKMLFKLQKKQNFPNGMYIVTLDKDEFKDICRKELYYCDICHKFKESIWLVTDGSVHVSTKKRDFTVMCKNEILKNLAIDCVTNNPKEKKIIKKLWEIFNIPENGEYQTILGGQKQWITYPMPPSWVVYKVLSTMN